MSEELDIRIQYNKDSAFVFELGDDGKRYELVRWTEDELTETENLDSLVDSTRQMVEKSPTKLVEKLFGTVEEWERQKEQRCLDD